MYLFFDLLASFDHWLVIRDVTEIIFRLQVRCRVCFTMAVVLQSTTGNCWNSGTSKEIACECFLFLKLTRECRECKDRLMVKWLCVHLINMYLPQYIHDVIQISETATWVLKIIMQCWSQESERMAFFRCFASAGAAPAVFWTLHPAALSPPISWTLQGQHKYTQFKTELTVSEHSKKGKALDSCKFWTTMSSKLK